MMLFQNPLWLSLIYRNFDLVQKYEGYPSGSMVDFACDADGSPILAVSSLAVHTKVCFLFKDLG